MPVFEFPSDRIVGVLDWDGSWNDQTGPVLATGLVVVPDDVAVGLDVQALRGAEPTGDGGWTIDVDQQASELGFLRRLPADGVESLTVHSSNESTFAAVAHLAPGLRKLYLAWSEFSDTVLETVAQLTGLTWLQTFGNNFTDRGVQQLATLTNLDHLYLEEGSLTAGAFNFVDQLPSLDRLGLQDVTMTSAELDRLRTRLPGVDVG